MNLTAAVEALFFTALEKATLTERAHYLDSACRGDAGLRQRVEKLLNAHPQVGNFLTTPAFEQMTTAPERDAPLAGQGADGGVGFLQPSTRPDSLGRLGQYEVFQVLGRGGSGIVLRAFDESLHRVVAVKVLTPTPTLAVTAAARTQFVSEARAAARVRHENVVQVYAVEEGPLPYLVMEYIPGETLQQRCDRTGPLAVGEVLQIGRQIAEGLAAAHATGLVHRDVKPANVLIEGGPRGHVKLTDFGLAVAADDPPPSRSAGVAGTPMYMAPEQATGGPLDHRADLFSLGSVLYTMLAGRPPFRASSPLEILKRVAEDAPRPIPEIVPEAPPAICALIARLHAKRPDDRFASAREVADLLDQLSHPVTVEPPPIVATPTTRRRSRPARWAVAAALLLSLGGLGFTEANGVTTVRGTVVRLFSPAGTLVIEVDDPAVNVHLDGSDLVIVGAGVREIRLKPGSYTLEARKGDKVVQRELVRVTRDGREVVRVSQEASPAPTDAAAWERSVAALPAAGQVKAVAARLKDLNPGFDGQVTPTLRDGAVTGLRFLSDAIDDIAPVRALTGLTALDCSGTFPSAGALADLSPLRGMRLTSLKARGTRVHDLSPLRGMPLVSLDLYVCGDVSDLASLKGMALTYVDLGSTQARDLNPLKGMPLTYLNLYRCPIPDLESLRGLPLGSLVLGSTQVRDLAPLEGMPLTTLNLWGCSQVKDLAPLRAMRLTYLHLGNSGVSDLRPLRDMPLEEFYLSPKSVSQGLEVIRDMKRLKSIGVAGDQARPATEFWARYDRGEFK